MRNILFVLFLIIIFSCRQNTSNDDLPPKKVAWIPRTSDIYAGPERGIDAVAEFPGKIQLEWKASDEPDLVKYLIFVSVDNLNFINEKILEIEQANNDQTFRYIASDSAFIFLYDIQEIEHGIGDPFNKPFYFYIKAEDEIGQRSEPSDTLSYALERAIGGLGVTIDNNSDTLLTWSWGNLQIIPNNIILRIEFNEFGSQWNPKLVKLFSADDPIFRQQFYDTPSVRVRDIRELYGVFTDKGQYRWRVDVYYSDQWGSESNWQIITIQ